MWVVTIPHRFKKNQKNLHIFDTDTLFGVYALTGSVCVDVGAHMPQPLWGQQKTLWVLVLYCYLI